MIELKIKKSDLEKIITLEEDYLVYKALRGAIAQLVLPKGTQIAVPRDYDIKRAKGVSSRKLRATRAFVLGIIHAERKWVRGAGGGLKKVAEYSSILSLQDTIGSKHQTSFRYKVGSMVKPRWSFNRYPNEVCSSGIHFFTHLEDAERWL